MSVSAQPSHYSGNVKFCGRFDSEAPEIQAMMTSIRQGLNASRTRSGASMQSATTIHSTCAITASVCCAGAAFRCAPTTRSMRLL
jgi:hypothetical protein